MNVLKIVFAGALALALVACESGREKETLGALLGAAAGALIGSQIGSGAGQAAAIGLGTVIGGLAGSQLGKALDDRDREIANAAAGRLEVDLGQSRFGQLRQLHAHRRALRQCRWRNLP